MDAIVDYDSIREKKKMAKSRCNDSYRFCPRDRGASSMLISNVDRERFVGGTIFCQDVLTFALEVMTSSIECRVMRITGSQAGGPDIFTLTTVSKANITLVEDRSDLRDSTCLAQKFVRTDGVAGRLFTTVTLAGIKYTGLVVIRGGKNVMTITVRTLDALDNTAVFLSLLSNSRLVVAGMGWRKDWISACNRGIYDEPVGLRHSPAHTKCMIRPSRLS
jgi:hypothetical protein